MKKQWKPLSRQQVINAVERNNPERIPLVMAKWWGEGLTDQYGDQLNAFNRIPDDIGFGWIDPIQYDSMNLSWKIEQTTGAHDSRFIIDDWNKLDEFIEKLPKASEDERFDELAVIAKKAHSEDRYFMFAWWGLFFERPWGIRGMTNLLMDYYLYPEEIHRLHQAVCDVYLDYIDRAVEVLSPDGFWCSDDLGTQRNLFMKPQTFREFLKPYYQQIGEKVKAKNVHWWLHSCGNNTAILGDLAEVGLDVFHPVQKHTMEEKSVAAEYGDKLTFLAGIDVQHVLQEMSPEEVRQEVRFLVDTFDQKHGGLCIAAGNGIVSGTPIQNIEAFLDEALEYGKIHRERMNQK